MFNVVQIEGFRSLRRLRLDSLKRLNLLVGTNNSGKTSVLEALNLLARVGDPNALYQSMSRRGERLPEEPDARASETEFDVCHLFTGHEITLGSSFSVMASNSYPSRTLTCTVSEIEEDEKSLFSSQALGSRTGLVLIIEGGPTPPFSSIPLSPRGGITPNSLQSMRRLPRTQSADTLPCVYISTDSLTSDGLTRLWDRLALTPDEEFVLDALRYLDPDIERVAALASSRLYASNSQNRGSFVVKMRGSNQPIPIGSMGDGMWRMLAMAIAVTQSKGGLLLIDEIDTGLHHTVMDGMWQMLARAAHEFNVQVFATTHSLDCVNSLAMSNIGDSGEDFSLQRVESGKSDSIPYTSAEIRAAADRGIEVR